VTLRCILVDDSHHFLAAARSLLERQGVTVVGTASTAGEVLRKVQEVQPDVTLVDINLGDESGLDLARELSRPTSAMPVILISTCAEEDYATLIAATPAIGFIPKTALSARAIRDLLSGEPNPATAPVSGPRGT
jgi:two-component system, NarL family, nitrate/nitrite response regulator NarL